MFKEKLKKIWEDKKYIELARKGSLDKRHPGMIILKRLANEAIKILDLGCGDGTRLNYLTNSGKIPGYGVDISRTAIQKARKAFPNLKFLKADLEDLPLGNNSIDLVYSAFVLEHLDNPEKVINEAIRVLKPRGKLVFIAPNYGAPNRASPPFKDSRMKKLFKGYISDLFIFVHDGKRLNWSKVTPISLSKRYGIDWDTTVEPYILSLIKYLRGMNFRILERSSCWNEELENAKTLQKIFRILGEAKIYPFSMWGPHIVAVSQKKVS